MRKNNSFGQILKATSITGGASVVTLLVSMLRTKFAAVLIGTGGVGLLTSLTAIQGVFSSISGLGIGSSAVRDVVTAIEIQDQLKIGRTVLILRRLSWIAGIIGMLTMISISSIISEWMFGSQTYSREIIALSVTILLANLSISQMALIQGMRQIKNMAKVNIVTSIFGSIGVFFFYISIGIKGVVPALLLAAIINLIGSWFYARKIFVQKVKMTWGESFYEASMMVQLGIAMMWAGLISSIAVYITVMMITKTINIQSVGIYSAAYSLSGMFVNFVLQAMGADYYPRLTGAVHNKDIMNRLVNEQTEIALLLALPGLMVTLCFAPWIVHVFYSSAFFPAATLLQWFILGCVIRVIQWPMGYLQLALGKSKIYFFTQTIFTIFQLFLTWFGLIIYGIEGVSIGFFVLYVVSIVVIYILSRRLTGFRWSIETYRLFTIFLPIILFTFITVRVFPGMLSTIMGIILTIAITTMCLRGMIQRIGLEHRLAKVICRIPGMRMVCGL